MADYSVRSAGDQDLEFMTEVDAAMRYKGSIWAHVIAVGLFLLFIAFLVWAGLTDRREVTQGSGYIIPSLGVQPVQSEEAGIIKEILVKEGQIVKQDALLAVITNEKAANDLQELTNRQKEFELGVVRLEAEQEGKEPIFSLEDRLNSPKVVEDQLLLYRTRTEKFQSEGEELRAVLQQRQAELKQAQLRLTQYNKVLSILYEKKNNIEPLVPKSYSEKDFNDLKFTIAAKESEMKKTGMDETRLTSAVQEALEKLNNRDNERANALAKELNEFRQELNSIKERLTAGKDLVSRATVRAVVPGTIKRILLKEEAVVRPAELIMEILPIGDDLEVLAKFKPSVRSYLAKGKSASVRITAYDSTVYGSLDATITLISPDTIEDAKGEPWYEVRLRTTSNKLVYKKDSWFGGGEEEELEIKPGMTVDVDVLSGEKSILAYLVKPLFKSQQKGKVIGEKSTEAAQ